MDGLMRRGSSGLFLFFSLLLGTLILVSCMGGDAADAAASPLEPPDLEPTFTEPQPPTPALTPTAPQLPTAPVDPQPSPVLIHGPNLQPGLPAGWSSSLVVSPSPDAFSNAFVGPESPVYVSWAVSDVGSSPTSEQFFVDLYLDGIVVERWTAGGLEADEPRVLRDWDELPLRARLAPGEHVLELVVDSTDLIREENETDNSYLLTFEWPRRGVPRQVSFIAPARLPNLVPFTPEGWAAPMQVLGSNGVTDNISPEGATRLRVAFKNEGLSSIDRFFLAYLYLDDFLVARFRERDLLADEAVITAEWSGLAEVVHPTPGRHTLTLVVDPTDLVDEVSESDNAVSTEFFWDSNLTLDLLEELPFGEIRPPTLDAFTPPGWDGPVVVTPQLGQLRSPALLPTTEPVYIHWAIRNIGDLDFHQPFTVELRLDENVVGTWIRSNLAAGEVDFILDWPLNPIAQPSSAGLHRLQLLVYQGTPEELGPAQTLTDRMLRWTENGLEETSIIRYSQRELERRLGGLDQILNTKESPIGESGGVSLETVMEIADAVYYTLHGGSLLNEDLSIHILTDEEYPHWVQIECQDTLSRLSARLQPAYRENCARLDGFAGFITQWRGQHRIVIRGQRPPIQVLGAIAHELGHFRQSLANPSLDDQLASLDFLALREAQAYAYQVLFLRTLEALTGRDLLLYPLLDGYERFVSARVESLLAQAESSEHARGRLLVWLALLTDPNLRQSRNVLLNDRALSAASAQDLFNYLTAFRPGVVDSYVANLMKGLRTQALAIQDLALSRLISGLPYWNEGSPYLREIGLLLP